VATVETNQTLKHFRVVDYLNLKRTNLSTIKTIKSHHPKHNYNNNNTNTNTDIDIDMNIYYIDIPKQLYWYWYWYWYW
jgi:hypothetical protein